MLTSADTRCFILSGFFEHHGWIADLCKDYAHYVNMMADLVDGCVEDPVASLDECIKMGTTYERAIVAKNDTRLMIPAMSDKGYFVIEGQEKVVLIQEVRLLTEPCITFVPLSQRPVGRESDKDYMPRCEVLIEGATVPVKVRIPNNYIAELDTDMIHNNVRGIKSIGIHEIVVGMYSSDKTSAYQKIHYLLRSYCGEHADACMCYIMSSAKGEGGLYIAEDKETIRSKMFGNMSDNLIIATLVIMVAMCVMVLMGFVLPSDRDNYAMKCLKTPGHLIYKIFKQCYKTSKNNSQLQRAVHRSIYTFIKRGDTTIGGRVYNKMSIQLSKRSYIDELSSVRKVVVPCDENSPNIKMRQIHDSQKGYICPCETPEGKTVGITKSLACSCLISTKTCIKEWILRCCKDNIFSGSVWAIVDGVVAGWCMLSDIRSIKSTYPTVSVTIQRHNIAVIRTDSGRPIRPLVEIRDHPVDWNNAASFSDMVLLGQIRYLDPVECASYNIASEGYDGDWTMFNYIEIHPCTLLGLAASMVPFPEHNQSARNVFSSSMVKQAMQMQGSEKTCDYLQKPLVCTTVAKDMGINENPNGINLVVCIMSINGFNQEDAIIIKKSALERGMFSYFAKHSTSVTVDNPWRMVTDDDKLYVLSGQTEKTMTEVRSMMLLKPDKPSLGIINIKESAADNGRSKVDVTIGEHRCLRLGDKLSSRHAQKGVVGMIMNEIDMPFTSCGVTPDIIINPHAIPSRMTVGQLLEGAFGKQAAITGTFMDGTPFLGHHKKDLCNALKVSDTEVVILGTTGEQVVTPVAMGIVYYMALAHQAKDKVYVRSVGPKSLMSKQPISGRSKGGGLRFGEMEYDCFIAHGTSRLITEVSQNSDMVDAPYCNTCKMVTDVFEDKCRMCESTTVTKQVPFSYLVFKDLMLAANINVTTDIT